MSVRVAPTGRPGEHWLVLEHATRPLSADAERKFTRYWRLMRWLGLTDNRSDVLDLMYLGLKHFRIPQETLRVMPTVFSDDELRTMQVPTLLLMGVHEVIFDPQKALALARQLIPHFEGDLVPQSSHDMCVSQHALVDARILGFLSNTRRDIQNVSSPELARGQGWAASHASTLP